MDLAVDIIKHDGSRPTERFMRNKLHASIVASCLSVHTPEGQSEEIADAVCNAVIAWLHKHPEITSADVRRVAGRHLKCHHPEAAYLYEQYSITI